MPDEHQPGEWLEKWKTLLRADEDLDIQLEACDDLSIEELCREFQRWGEAATERLRVQGKLLEAALEALGLDHHGPPQTAENPDPPPKPPFKE